MGFGDPIFRQTYIPSMPGLRIIPGWPVHLHPQVVRGNMF